MEEDGDVRGPLFEHIVFTIIPGDELDEALARDIVSALTASGGEYQPLRESDSHIEDIESLTHIVSTHIDFPQYNRALELGTFVVKPQWVFQSMRRRKLAFTRQYSPDPSQFFHDVIVTTADLPDNDAEAIIGGVVALGGQFSPRMSKLVTHIVTNSMDHPRVELANRADPSCKIVLPHWFQACFLLGKKINEKPYMLPDPEILRRDNKSAVRALASPHIDGATTASPSKEPFPSPPPSPSYLRKTLNALKGRKLFLAADLPLSNDLTQVLTKLITQSEGLIVRNVDDADIYIGHWRDGQDYVAASQAGKEVANLTWLYHVINRNTYTSPLRRVFHYPLPREGVRGFENLKISLSNYSGESRTYVENLIRACGAEYTKTMKQDNTHLITAHKSGEKCEAAEEWNINVVNHLWLEESYAKCAVLSPTNRKYTTFPARTNLGEVTGQTSLDMKSVERYYFPRPRSPQKPASIQKPTAKNKTPVSAKTPLRSPTFEAVETDGPQAADNDGMEVDAETAPSTAKRPRGRPPKSAIETPRLVSEEKENDSPLPPSTGRAAKNKALDNIHGSAADIALYQRESKRPGGVVHGGRFPRAQESSPAPQRKKRASDEYDPTGIGSDLSDGETQDPRAKQAKKAKTATGQTLPPVEYKMMVTGDERWNNNARKESADKILLRSIGVQLIQDPKAVEILVAPKILRTKKFVCALASAPLVVHTSFLDTALSKKKLMQNPPMLKDKDGEERLGFKLADAIQCAKANARKLFRGWTIFVTEDINGGFDTYKDIISANGGSAMLYKGRLGVTVTKRQGRDDPDAGEEASNQGDDNECDYVYLVSGKTDKEVKLWKTFRENASKQDLAARIVASDWLLNAAMSQLVTLDEKWMLDEDTVMSQRKG
ncbi:BRCT-containing 1 [Lecanosticta acicola]|uniref:BRCT-containing 1 n=1 Tax=Lecanosticta acicola TaxID=111012 RepID=A0AAI9EDS3_9PEZI|nr:BRCT-containing 1 [Lecanosticta acicola]